MVTLNDRDPPALPWQWSMTRDTVQCAHPDCPNPAHHELLRLDGGDFPTFCDTHVMHARLATHWAERALTGQSLDGIVHMGAHPDDAALRDLVGATRTEDLVKAVEKRIQDLLEANTRKVNQYRAAAETTVHQAHLIQALERDHRHVHLGRIIQEIREWQAATFPSGGIRGPVTHMLKEAKEAFADMETLEAMLDAGNFLREDIEEAKAKLAEETADVVFLGIQVFTRLARSMDSALDSKLTKNKARKWGRPDASGVVEHVREDGTNG